MVKTFVWDSSNVNTREYPLSEMAGALQEGNTLEYVFNIKFI